MPRLPLIRALLLVIIGCTAVHAASERRVALVIGVGGYRHAPALTNPANDAKLIGPALQKLDFDVQVVVDPDYETLRNALRDFERRLDGAQVALFFYAGHGLQVAGRNYLLPTTAALARETDLRYEAFDVQAVLDAMDRPGRVNLVFLDACRDNPLGRSLAASLGSRSSAVSRGLAMINSQTVSGSLIAYATAPGDVAQDGAGRNSPFTTALAKHIGTPGLDVRQMLTRVRADVQKATSGKQRPWVNESLDSDFYFSPQIVQPPAPPVASPPPPPAMASMEVVFWESIKTSRNPADFRAYLDKFPDGLFVGLARNRIAELAPPPAAPPRDTSPVTAPAPPSDDPMGTETERRAIQTALTTLGYYRGPINGDLLAAARPAVRAWQTFAGAQDTGRLTAEQRDRVLHEADRLAALLKVPDVSPRGTPAARHRGAQARVLLGDDFEKGARGQPRDLAEAAYWYALAAREGDLDACTNLGRLLAIREPQDMEGARLLWLAAAARGGDKEGTVFYNLGLLTEKGRGVPADAVAARRWYSRAAERKHPDSIKALKRLGG